MTWAATAQQQDGVISWTQLGASGLSRSALSRMLRRGDVTRLGARTFLVRGAPLTYRARLWAAVLSTGGVLGFATAAHLWGVVAEEPVQVHVVVPHSRRVYPPPWVRVHRVFVPAAAITVCEGLPATTRSWTVLDHLPTLRAVERARLADRAVQRGWLTRRAVEDRLAGYPGRAGNRALRGLLQQLGDGAAAQSERELHRILRRAGLRGWQANFPVWFGGELVGVLDVAFPDRKVAIEIDGWAFHSDVERFQRDRNKQNALVALGWTVLRFTWADLVHRPGYVRAAIAGVAA
jgi:very-short-patch-repair endonuclease